MKLRVYCPFFLFYLYQKTRWFLSDCMSSSRSLTARRKTEDTLLLPLYYGSCLNMEKSLKSSTYINVYKSNLTVPIQSDKPPKHLLQSLSVNTQILLVCDKIIYQIKWYENNDLNQHRFIQTKVIQPVSIMLYLKIQSLWFSCTSILI